MSPQVRRRIAAYLAVGCVLVLAEASIIPLVTDLRPECKVAQEWVSSHQDRLPTTLADLSGFPVSYRRAIFAALPNETKAELWRGQLQEALRGKLTVAQRNALTQVVAFVRPNTYRDRVRPSEDLKALVATAFSAAERDSLFYRLGPERPSMTANYEALAARVALAARNWPVVAAIRKSSVASAAACDCNVGSWFCNGCDGTFYPMAYMCKGGGGCDIQQDGCGWGWQYPCNGRCLYVMCCEVCEVNP